MVSHVMLFPAVTLKGNPIKAGEILTNVNVGDLFICQVPKNSEFVMRGGEDFKKEFQHAGNIQTSRSLVEDQIKSRLHFTTYVESGVYVCGAGKDAIPFVIYEIS
eukprot:scpid99540/ scgid27410/ 